MQGIGQLDVVAVATLALEQGRIFLARHGLADAEFEQMSIIGGDGHVHGLSVEIGGQRNVVRPCYRCKNSAQSLLGSGMSAIAWELPEEVRAVRDGLADFARSIVQRLLKGDTEL